MVLSVPFLPTIKVATVPVFEYRRPFFSKTQKYRFDLNVACWVKLLDTRTTVSIEVVVEYLDGSNISGVKVACATQKPNYSVLMLSGVAPIVVKNDIRDMWVGIRGAQESSFEVEELFVQRAKKGSSQSQLPKFRF